MLRRMFAVMIAVAMVCSVRISSTNAQQQPVGGYYAFVETTGTASGMGGCYCVDPNGTVYRVIAETATVGSASATQVSFIPVGFFNGTKVQAYTAGMVTAYTVGSSGEAKGEATIESPRATLDIINDLGTTGPGSVVSYTSVDPASYAPSTSTLMGLSASLNSVVYGNAGYTKRTNQGLSTGIIGGISLVGHGGALNYQIVDLANIFGLSTGSGLDDHSQSGSYGNAWYATPQDNGAQTYFGGTGTGIHDWTSLISTSSTNPSPAMPTLPTSIGLASFNLR